jgi:hypothetical protein
MAVTDTVDGAHRTGSADIAEHEWVAGYLYREEPRLAPPTTPVDAGAPDTLPDDVAGESEPAGDNENADADADHGGDGDVTDLDAAPDRAAEDVNAGAKRTAVALGMVLVLAICAIVGTLMVFGHDAAPTAAPTEDQPARVGPSPAPLSLAPAADQDQAIAFTASANCPPGSTAAQALTETDRDSAWVCVRGAAGAQVDGQVLHIDFGRAYQVSAVAVTPGWVAKTSGGQEEWLQHRVVSQLQYVFNDDDRTIVTQSTGDTHGPVTMALPHKVLASRVTVIVLQTVRPPTTPAPSIGPPGMPQPGFLDSVLGTGGAPPPTDATETTDPAPSGEPGADPVDATFAISEMKFFGYQPK